MNIKKHGHRWRYIFLGLLISFTPSFAISSNQTAANQAAQAYGFVLGQDYSLSQIAKEYQGLSWEVDIIRAYFDAAFPHIKLKLEAKLRQILGKELFQITVTKLQADMLRAVDQMQITREAAVDFIEKVKARSKGDMESPVLEYLLAVKYSANPVGEFSDGFRQRFRTDGTGKSQGIKLALQVPRSWAGEEGERPHIVQKWVSENGTGLGIILLYIKAVQGYTPSKREIVEYVRSGEVRGSVPDGSEYVSSGNFTLEMQTGYWVQMSTLQERVGIRTYQDALMYHFFFKGKLIGLMCNATGDEKERAKVNEEFGRIMPLCQQVLNSFVLEDAY